jgi:hypothetical protein
MENIKMDAYFDAPLKKSTFHGKRSFRDMNALLKSTKDKSMLVFETANSEESSDD